MVKVKEILAEAKASGRVTIQSLQKKFGLSEEQACRVLRLLWEKGKLMPATNSFFMIPVNGHPTEWSTSGRSKQGAVFVDKVMAIVEEQPDMALTIVDVEEALECTKNVARAALQRCVLEGKLISKRSESGGRFGQPPWMFGKDEAALDAREEKILDDLSEKRAEAGKKAKGKKKRGEPSRDEEGLLRDVNGDLIVEVATPIGRVGFHSDEDDTADVYVLNKETGEWESES